MSANDATPKKATTNGETTPAAKRDPEASPVAPGAPIAKRVCVRLVLGTAPTLSPMELGNNLPPKNLSAVLQYGKVGLDAKFDMELLVKANADEIPDTIVLTMLADISYSMGSRADPDSPISLLVKFLRDFLTTGIPGKRLFLRLITFGEKVHVLGDDVEPLVELTDETRPQFLKLLEPDQFNGLEGQTNISGGVEAGLKTLDAYLAKKDLRAPTQHVVCLTDGAANTGIIRGQPFHKMVKKAVQWTDTYVHFIGLGGGVHENFMDEVTSKGTVGIFAVAPNATAIPAAYEKVFGYIARAAGSFDVCVRSGEGTKITRLGMLTSEREALMPVSVPPSAIEGTFPVVHVSLAKNGKVVGPEINLSVTYAAGVVKEDENAEVREMLQERQVEQDREKAMMNACSMKEAREALEENEAVYRSMGYSAKAMSKAAADSAAVKEAEEDSQWRSLSGAKGARMMSVALSSQAY